ncbi:MAG: sigma-70 family RNA polymerase sigma factor [Candidatus Cloacimonadota bacterium]
MQSHDIPPKRQDSKTITGFPEDFLPLAYSLAASYRDRGLELDDLRQEALIGLLKAAEHYDSDREAKFSTYAVYWIKKQIIEALEKESRHSLQASSLENCPEKLWDKTPEPELEPVSRISLPKGLPEIEERVLRMSLEQKLPLCEIARSLGLSTERCKLIKLKALRRIRCSLSKTPD